MNGPVHNLLVQFFTLGSSKMEFFETCFYDIVTTQYDHPRYVEPVLAVFMCFSRYLGIGFGGGGGQRGLVHNLLMQFFGPYSSKVEFFETYFFRIL